MFKILKNSSIVDVTDSLNYVRYQSKNGIFVSCSENDAQAIVSSDGTNIWHIKNKDSITGKDIEDVEIVTISLEEYELLKSAMEEALQSGENILEDNSATILEDEESTEEDVIEFLTNEKVKAMSAFCSDVIKKGFVITLSDGINHKFALTIEDQINMLALKDSLEAGDELIPYHSSNELCRYYKAEDIKLIIEFGEIFKNYHMFYFNSLKNYIKSLTDVEKIQAIEYGIDVPDEYKSVVFKEFLEQHQEVLNG